ncbi:MAG: hypothetical protein EB103_04585, partial [Actinobacteria bacterium]|nr:hypothetical protein [Actinomycetota bacterium]
MLMTILAIGSGCCTATKGAAIPENTRESLIKHVQESTVALVQGPKDERETYCAGVWIDEKTILTAAHCVEISGRILFEIPFSKEYEPQGDVITFVNHSDLKDNDITKDTIWAGVVEKFDRKKDLATIHVLGDTSPHTIAKFVEDPIVTGQSLHIMGHTVGMIWSYSHGYVATTRKVQGPNDTTV